MIHMLCSVLFSLLIHFSTALDIVNSSFRSWQLTEDHTGFNFFKGFTFYTQADPTWGYVDYQSSSAATAAGLIKMTANSVMIKADNSSVATGRGRKSVRITSNQPYNGGLFILDIQHMPAGCGTWPAYWMVGPNWPHNGEADILEGVNEMTYGASTLHTGPGCDFKGVAQHMTGHFMTGANGQPATNCDINAANQFGNQGCPIANRDGTFGAPFNKKQGGVLVTMWDPSYGFKMWLFERTLIPADIKQKKPDPTRWGLPYADFPFQANCPAKTFQNMHVIFNLDFCGGWAGGTFAAGSCKRYGTDCVAFVRDNPKQFDEAYWLINSYRVYQ